MPSKGIKKPQNAFQQNVFSGLVLRKIPVGDSLPPGRAPPLSVSQHLFVQYTYKNYTKQYKLKIVQLISNHYIFFKIKTQLINCDKEIYCHFKFYYKVRYCFYYSILNTYNNNIIRNTNFTSKLELLI